MGQIAHLDKKNTNNSIDNLVWLCLEHHTEYDSITSQNKNYTISEVKSYKNELQGFILNNPKLDEITKKRFDTNKPYCLLFSGVDEYLTIDDSNFKKVKQFNIQLNFKLFNNRYTGTFLSLVNINSKAYFYLIYFSKENKEYGGEIQLRYSDENKTKHILISILSIEEEWKNLHLDFETNKIRLRFDNQMATAFHKFNFELNQIQIGGRAFEKEMGSNFLSFYASRFTLLDIEKDYLVKDLIFDYGEDYYNSLPRNSGVEFINFDNLFVKL